MLKLFQYLTRFKLAMLGIIVLLVVQAYCDLALPEYTSDLVDVGIQQSGVESAAPSQLREETFRALELFITDDERATAEASYDLGSDGIYRLNTDNQDTIDQISSIFGLPMVIVSSMEDSGQMDTATLLQMTDAGMITQEQLLQARDTALEQMGNLSDSIIEQKAILFVQSEYEAMGMDLSSVQRSYLLIEGGKMLGVSLIIVVASVLIGLIASRVAAQIGMELRGKVFQKVVSFSSAEMDRFSTASLITRSTNDIQQVQMVIVMMLRMVMYAPVLGIGGVIKVMTTQTGMSWIIGLAVGVVLMIVVVLINVTMPKFKRMQGLVDQLNLISREILTGITVIRAFSREKHEEGRFETANRDLMNTQLFTNRVMSFMMPGMMFIMNAVSVLIVWVGGHGIDAGNLQVGDMIAFITYAMLIVMSFLMLTMISIMLPRAGVAAERIDEVIRSETSIHDAQRVLDDTRTDWNGVVSFEHVSFRYPDADEDVLSDISFTAEPGQTTAIIGSTGSGKSTLLNLIPRFFDVTGGRVTMDGTDIRELSQKKLRSLLGYVPQKGVLFSGTIDSNLKFGGDSITDEAAGQAAAIAQAKEFIDSKPEGYETHIAQGGSNVSGGQKQRLSIARAIAKQPKVFLFDDSFSALDYKTDVTLRRALNENIKDATVIIVAQRISTILHADQIVVLDEGRVAGMGNHETLMKTCPIYQEIAKSQLSEAELGGVLA
ncbi:MAG: ABC-type multidrug transport system, ATPase and permease component [Oscillospiraceae bacterium]|nr:ABC-type multidrug transport system, ATPase and permease component [Oscillospiraceae bacterium]